MPQSHKANLFLIAAPRSGSTQLAAWLASHPDIFVSMVKEPNFFAQHEFPEEYVSEQRLNCINPADYVRNRMTEQFNFCIFRTQSEYDYLFSTATTRWRVDASTTYLSCPESAELIHQYNDSARCLVLLRDPVARAVSHYRLRIRLGRTSASLASELDDELQGCVPVAGQYLIRPSQYADALARYSRNAKPERLKIVIFEKMIRDPKGTMDEICQWLEIDPLKVSFDAVDKNSSAAPRFPFLVRWFHRSGLRQLMRRYFSYTAWQRIKSIWYSESRQVPVSKEEIEILTKAMETEYANLRKNFPEIAEHWQQAAR